MSQITKNSNYYKDYLRNGDSEGSEYELLKEEKGRHAEKLAKAPARQIKDGHEYMAIQAPALQKNDSDNYSDTNNVSEVSFQPSVKTICTGLL